MNFKTFALALIISTSSYAQINPQDQYGINLQKQYDQAVQQAQGSSTDAYDVVMNWCDNSVRSLDDAMARFRNQVISGNNSGAFNELQNGLYRVSSSMSFGAKRSPFVKLASDRALLVANTLQKKGMAADLGALHALESLTRNVIEVAYRFDVDYYVPYVHRYNRNCSSYCSEGFIERMQRQALYFASNQVEAVLGSLTTNVGGDIRPVGHASIYLNTAEIISIMTANDLNANIFASRIPCTISRLRNTGLQLRSFNQGNTGYYGSVRTAVNDSAANMAEAARNIDGADYCARW
jgi:hypothetical protein